MLLHFQPYHDQGIVLDDRGCPIDFKEHNMHDNPLIPQFYTNVEDVSFELYLV